MQNKLNIYQKLLNVKKKIAYIKQTGKVEFAKTKYKFAGSESVLLELNPVLNDFGLFLQTEIIDQVVETNNSGYFTKLKIKYTWINCDNPEEHINCFWYAQGVDSSEKGIGKALTYAERYFLLKTFNIPTGQDDPELHDQANYKSEQKKQNKSGATNSGPETKPERIKTDPFELKRKYDQWFEKVKNLDQLEKTVDHFYLNYPELKNDKDFADRLLEIKNIIDGKTP